MTTTNDPAASGGLPQASRTAGPAHDVSAADPLASPSTSTSSTPAQASTRPPECQTPAERAQLVTVTLSREDLGAAHYALEMLETRLPSLNRPAMRETIERVAVAIVAAVNEAALFAGIRKGYGGRSEARQRCERRNAAAIVDALLAAGFELNLNNDADDEGTGENEGLALADWTRSRAVILAAMFAVDCETLCARKPDDKKKRRSGVFFVYGNADDGSEVVSDYHTSLEAVIGPVMAAFPGSND
jgi:hypothetical protein